MIMVLRSASANWICAKPQVWNIGAERNDGRWWRIGMRLMMEEAGMYVFGSGRRAPFGVPVVPEVRMMVRP